MQVASKFNLVAETGLHTAVTMHALKVRFTWQWRLKVQISKSGTARRLDKTTHALASPTSRETPFLQARLGSAI